MQPHRIAGIVQLIRFLQTETERLSVTRSGDLGPRLTIIKVTVASLFLYGVATTALFGQHHGRLTTISF